MEDGTLEYANIRSYPNQNANCGKYSIIKRGYPYIVKLALYGRG
jgi:hypothetical protein